MLSWCFPSLQEFHGSGHYGINGNDDILRENVKINDDIKKIVFKHAGIHLIEIKHENFKQNGSNYLDLNEIFNSLKYTATKIQEASEPQYWILEKEMANTFKE